MSETEIKPIPSENEEEYEETSETSTSKPRPAQIEKTVRTEETVKRQSKRREQPKESEIEDFEDKKVLVQMNIHNSTKELIKKEAHERGVSRATVVRDSLSEHFRNKDKLINENPDQKENMEKIQSAIDLSVDWLGSFNMENFLALAQENKLVGDTVWTPETLEAYLIPKIREASKGFLSPSIEDNCNECITALQLTNPKNLEFLAKQLGLTYAEEEQEVESEKGFFEELM